MEKTANLNIRIDSNLKKNAEVLFKDLGLNMSMAINLFLKQAVSKQSIPFEIAKIPNKETMKAIKEGEKMLKNPNKYKTYSEEDFRKLLYNKG